MPFLEVGPETRELEDGSGLDTQVTDPSPLEPPFPEGRVDAAEGEYLLGPDCRPGARCSHHVTSFGLSQQPYEARPGCRLRSACLQSQAFSPHLAGWAVAGTGTPIGSDPPGTSHSRRAGSTLWPRQACISRTYLPGAMPPAAVRAKWGAIMSRAGVQGGRGF